MIALALALTLGTELQLTLPPGATVDDQWFRENPTARVELEEGAEIVVERYLRKNALGLKPSSFPAALTSEGSPDKVATSTKKLGGRKVTLYELKRPAIAGRRPDADAYHDILGAGEPGVRSKLERCKELGVYDLPAAHNESLEDKDPKGRANFQKLFLDHERTAKRIEVCLGFPLLAQMLRGEPVRDPPKPPDEAELKRLEAADKAPDAPEGRESVAVVEAEGRFYVLRYSAPKESFKKGLPAFEKVISSMKFLPKP